MDKKHEIPEDEPVMANKQIAPYVARDTEIMPQKCRLTLHVNIP